MEVSKFGRRLLRDADGQVLLFGAIVILLLFVFMLAIPNGTRVVTQKMRVQTAADAGAFTGSVWLARALNLSANMNIGIKSVYEWMTVLTMGNALAQALCNDSLDESVKTMGRELDLALFGTTDPVTTSSIEYPDAIRKLDTTAQWLQDLQDDIVASFPQVAQTMGKYEACQNASGNPSSENPGGAAIVRTNEVDSLGNPIPMLVETGAGDTAMYTDLMQLVPLLESIPTNDVNIGDATGLILIDPNSYEIKAYYGCKSNWCTLVQRLIIGQTTVNQWYSLAPATPDTNNHLFSAHRHYVDHKDPRIDSACGKSWIGGGVDIWYLGDTILDPSQGEWRCYGKKSYSVPHPGDTVWAHQRHWKLWEPGMEVPPGETAEAAKPWINDGYYIDSSWADPYDTDFYTGAESTNGNQGTRLSPRRLNPDRVFHSVAYVWQLGAATGPRGLGLPMGGSLFPRDRVAAPAPMLTVARSVLHLDVASPTPADYFFTPAWDAKLAPMDAAGVLDISRDVAYDTLRFDTLGLDSVNLEDLRNYVLLP